MISNMRTFLVLALLLSFLCENAISFSSITIPTTNQCRDVNNLQLFRLGLAATKDNGIKATDDDDDHDDDGARSFPRVGKPPPPPPLPQRIPSPPSPVSSLESVDWNDVGSNIFDEVKDISSSIFLAITPIFQSDATVKVEDIVLVCDELDQIEKQRQEEKEVIIGSNNDPSIHLPNLSLLVRENALKFKRYELLTKLMRSNYETYVTTASFLSPNRIPRLQLPNLQDIPYNNNNNEKEESKTKNAIKDENGIPLVPDCELDNIQFQESILDKILLSIFRKLVTKNTGGITSDKDGIQGLLEQGRTYMLQSYQTPEKQHQMVYDTLSGLMTPILPPFYRIFMSGIIPKLGTELDGKQIGPWFYAPYLTSIVTPTFFGFLVGPSYPNRRKDGQLGGLVVEKCKFLQESNCKGLCIHQCKLPAQQFFQEELGLPLSVQPNFVTQECQWNFGELPIPIEDDPSFPKGCLIGCESRKAINNNAESPGYVNLCN